MEYLKDNRSTVDLDVDTLTVKNEKGIQKFIEKSSKIEGIVLSSTLTKQQAIFEMLHLETEENDKKLKLGSKRMFEKVMMNREIEEGDRRKANMLRI
jgi:hypothetical protein